MEKSIVKQVSILFIIKAMVTWWKNTLYNTRQRSEGDPWISATYFTWFLTWILRCFGTHSMGLICVLAPDMFYSLNMRLTSDRHLFFLRDLDLESGSQCELRCVFPVNTMECSILYMSEYVWIKHTVWTYPRATQVYEHDCSIFLISSFPSVHGRMD